MALASKPAHRAQAPWGAPACTIPRLGFNAGAWSCERSIASRARVGCPDLGPTRCASCSPSSTAGRCATAGCARPHLPRLPPGDGLPPAPRGRRRSRGASPRLLRPLLPRRSRALDARDRRPLGERLHPGGQDRRALTHTPREAATGFEPVHGGFADLSLSHLGTPPLRQRVGPVEGSTGLTASSLALRFSAFRWRFSSAFIRRSASRRSRTLLLKARPPAMGLPPAGQ